MANHEFAFNLYVEIDVEEWKEEHSWPEEDGEPSNDDIGVWFADECSNMLGLQWPNVYCVRTD